MTYWLLKTEPVAYSWEQLTKDKKTLWTGIRNFQARNNLRAMEIGDIAFIYHSGDEKSIVGVAKVVASAVPEKTADEGDWVAVEIEALTPLTNEIGIEEIRNSPVLSGMLLLQQPRLSVSLVTEPQAEMIFKISKTKLA